MVERLVRNEEASGSNPLISTKTKTRLRGVFFVLWLSVRRTAELSAVRARRQAYVTLFLLYFLSLPTMLPRNAWVYSLSPPKKDVPNDISFLCVVEVIDAHAVVPF